MSDNCWVVRGEAILLTTLAVAGTAVWIPRTARICLCVRRAVFAFASSFSSSFSSCDAALVQPSGRLLAIITDHNGWGCNYGSGQGTEGTECPWQLAFYAPRIEVEEPPGLALAPQQETS